MKVRKSQDGKRVLGGKLRATSVHRQTNVPRTVRPHKTACPETQKTCREPHTGSPCLETWSICLRKRHALPGVQAGGQREGQMGTEARRCKEKGDLCGESGRQEKQLGR